MPLDDRWSGSSSRSGVLALVSAVLALLGGGCAQDAAPCQLPASPSFARDVAPIVSPACTRCHATTLTGAARQGAPVGIDFDTEAAARQGAAWSMQRIAERTLAGSEHTLTACQQRLVLRWVTVDAGSNVDARGDAGGSDSGCPSCGTGGCIDTQSDPRHCGGCGKACPQGAACVASTCRCPAATIDCGSGRCVDTTSDPQHCGGCDKPCSGAQVCNTGSCSSGCAPLTQCGSACVETQSSLQHCGGCDKPCAVGASCTKGSCVCPTGQVACGGICLDTQTNAQHCGGCNKPCGSGESCTAGQCVCAAGNVSFAQAVQPIFSQRCATIGCHVGAVPKEGLDLSAGKAFSALVKVAAQQCSDGRARVAPGNPAASYLMQKLLNVDLCKGGQMPKQGVSLSAAEIATISGWICAGAPNN